MCANRQFYYCAAAISSDVSSSLNIVKYYFTLIEGNDWLLNK